MPSAEKLTPTFIIYTNGIRLGSEIESSVKLIRVQNRINTMSSFSITFSDPYKKIMDNKDLFLGTQMRILLGYKDSVEEIAEYEVTGIKCDFTWHGGISTTINGKCHLHRLNRGRRNRGYNDMNTADIVRKLCDEYKLNSEVDIKSEVKPFRLQRNYTDYEYLLNLNDEHNCYLWSNKKTVYLKKESDTSTEEIVLEKGKTLVSFYGGSQSAGLFTEAVVRGRNPSTLEFIETTVSGSSVERKIGGNTSTPEYLEDKISKHKEYVTDYSIKNIKEAEELGKKILEQNSMRYINFTGECQGDPKIKAGMTITIKGMGEQYSGEYFLKQVEHELIPMTGYTVTFEAVRNAREVKKGSGLAANSLLDKIKQALKGKLNPSFTNLQWMQDGNVIDIAMIGAEVTLTADASQIATGSSVEINIYEKDTNSPDDFIETIKGKVTNGKVEGKWKVIYVEDDDDEDSEKEMLEKGYTLPEYIFTIKSNGEESEQSPLLNVQDYIEIRLKDEDGNPIADAKY